MIVACGLWPGVYTPGHSLMEIPLPTLVTPTYDENMWTKDRLFSRYKLARGTTLLVSGTTVTQATYPYQEDLSAYDYVYLGGHEYPLSPTEVTILTNAGYGAYIH